MSDEVCQLILAHLPKRWRNAWNAETPNFHPIIQHGWFDPCRIIDVSLCKSRQLKRQNAGKLGKLHQALEEQPMPQVLLSLFPHKTHFFRSFCLILIHCC